MKQNKVKQSSRQVNESSWWARWEPQPWVLANSVHSFCVSGKDHVAWQSCTRCSALFSWMCSSFPEPHPKIRLLGGVGAGEDGWQWHTEAPALSSFVQVRACFVISFFKADSVAYCCEWWNMYLLLFTSWALKELQASFNRDTGLLWCFSCIPVGSESHTCSGLLLQLSGEQSTSHLTWQRVKILFFFLSDTSLPQ